MQSARDSDRQECIPFPPSWGAPRIHGELLKLGLEISERTVSRYLARVGRKGDARKLWLIFLRNHREVIAAMDFFTVPTATFRVLYCFFVISHTGGESSTSTPRSIRQVVGLRSNYERSFPTTPHLAT